MAKIEAKILDLIPESLRPGLIKEVRELIKKQDEEKVKEANPLIKNYLNEKGTHVKR